ncbi:unnamed protein product, partial [Ectocarpus sp. 13 AM-2016]
MGPSGRFVPTKGLNPILQTEHCLGRATSQPSTRRHTPSALDRQRTNDRRRACCLCGHTQHRQTASLHKKREPTKNGEHHACDATYLITHLQQQCGAVLACSSEAMWDLAPRPPQDTWSSPRKQT